MKGFVALAASLLALASSAFAGQQPDKIYGVNLGSWLLLESWMLPAEWVAMGGEICANCADCISTEFALAKAYPDTVDEKFEKHWSTWFTQDDVTKLKDLGINTVRVPLGYWLVEPLVNRTDEYYPRGGLRHLKEGLQWLRDAGISVILDHHALPGAQTPDQMFTGSCTSDVEFYTPKNYHRALIWTAVMTTFSHLDSDFESVFAIEAVNEPIMDASQTPGYGDFQKQFVQVVRAVEFVLGINSSLTLDVDIDISANFTSALSSICDSESLDEEVASALRDSIPVLLRMIFEYEDWSLLSGWFREDRAPLTTNFMDIKWQNNNPPNPADAAIGPQGYDHHLYYSFGGVADATEEAYMENICNRKDVQSDAELNNKPLWYGEWGLSTQFNATDEFLHNWADAQKLTYSQGAGWLFWNFKIEISELAGDLARQWSYMEGVELGYLTQDPSQYNNISVCEPYLTSTSTS